MPRTGYTQHDQDTDDFCRDEALRHWARFGEYIEPYTASGLAPSLDESHERLRRLAQGDRAMKSPRTRSARQKGLTSLKKSKRRGSPYYRDGGDASKHKKKPRWLEWRCSECGKAVKIADGSTPSCPECGYKPVV